MSKPAVSFFDKYSLVIPPKLIWHQDGIPGQRVFFISDKKETVVVSFEEGMKPVDMTPDTDKSVPTVSYQCCKDGKYIHQKRNTAGNMAYSYFHIELEDDDGKTYSLPGQMVVFQRLPLDGRHQAGTDEIAGRHRRMQDERRW